MEGRIEKFKKIMEPCKERVSSVALDWLIGNDFFIAPASINHHGAYTGGLFEHSLVVTEQLLKLTKQLDLKWTYKESPYIVGMFHDLCNPFPPLPWPKARRPASTTTGTPREWHLPGL